ncbi:MAG: YhdT family protein, partial [Bilophila sp.]
EALLSLGMYALYFVWWYVCAYGLGSGDPANYSYVLGMPAWFFYSCILGYPLLSFALWLMVRVFFKNIPLDEEGVDEEETSAESTRTNLDDERHPEIV